jgi:hypothetical protein
MVPFQKEGSQRRGSVFVRRDCFERFRNTQTQENNEEEEAKVEREKDLFLVHRELKESRGYKLFREFLVNVFDLTSLFGKTGVFFISKRDQLNCDLTKTTITWRKDPCQESLMEGSLWIHLQDLDSKIMGSLSKEFVPWFPSKTSQTKH